MQSYQEDYIDEIKIIKLHKKCNKKDWKVLQPKALSKSDEPKKVSGPIEKVSGPIDDLSKEEQKPIKASSDGKKTATKAEKKLKRSRSLKKKHRSLQSLLLQTQMTRTMNKGLL